MLPKNKRFTRADIAAFTANPSVLTVYNKLGTLKYLPRGHRLAVVTSSKHEKRAVARNKLRRRIYNHFRASPIQLSGILYVSKHSYQLPTDTLKELADALFGKIS